MSFILDALRKSDQQRQRSGAPTLMTAQIPLAQPKPFLWWWYAILAAVLMGAGILIGWMHQLPSEPSESPASALPAGGGKPLEASPQKFTPAPLPALPASPGKPEQQLPVESKVATQVAPAPAVASSPSNKPDKPVMAEPPPAAINPKAAFVPAQEQHSANHPGDAAREPAAREPAVVALTDLPPALQQEIPKLAILAHSYSSKPRDRFVFINDRMWREAEYPWPGLKLEQITADGMVFSYKGYRFRRGTNP